MTGFKISESATASTAASSSSSAIITELSNESVSQSLSASPSNETTVRHVKTALSEQVDAKRHSMSSSINRHKSTSDHLLELPVTSSQSTTTQSLNKLLPSRTTTTTTTTATTFHHSISTTESKHVMKMIIS